MEQTWRTKRGERYEIIWKYEITSIHIFLTTTNNINTYEANMKTYYGVVWFVFCRFTFVVFQGRVSLTTRVYKTKMGPNHAKLTSNKCHCEHFKNTKSCFKTLVRFQSEHINLICSMIRQAFREFFDLDFNFVGHTLLN